MTAASPFSVLSRLQDALLGQARHDLEAGAYEACWTRLEMVLKDGEWNEAATPLCLRLFLSLALGAVHQAANIAFYLTGGFPAAARSAAMAEMLDRLAGWDRLPGLIAGLGLDYPLRDPSALIERLAALAMPVDDPAWRQPLDAACPETERPVVVVSLVNGLGNQLFQYAAALRRARRCGAVLKLDLSLFASDRVGTRPFALAPFAIEAAVAGTEDLARVDAHRHVDDISKVDAALMTGAGDCRLLGVWPSALYFQGVEAELRESLRLRDEALAQRAASAVTALRRRGPVIGMHVRLGDLRSPVYRNALAPLPVAYYRAALQHFPGDRTVVIFSDTPDDREWCAATFADLGGTVEIARDRSDIEDFAFLTACDHQIISSSSFSWWAAWLNPNPDKRVIAPHPAFGPGPRAAHVLLAGRVPAEWTMLCRDDVP
jgi:hypothetical protein